MFSKYKYLLIILLSTGFALIVGFAGSYYWIKNVYLKEKIELKVNATKLTEWYQEDKFVPPKDNKITDRQMVAFLQTNQHLSYLLERMQKQLEENSWSIAIEVIKLQPEWQAKKYIALQESNLSPMEYDWITNQVVHFWIYQWKEESLQILKEYGWSFDNLRHDEDTIIVNLELLQKYEKELIKTFNLLWPDQDTPKMLAADSLAN